MIVLILAFVLLQVEEQVNEVMGLYSVIVFKNFFIWVSIPSPFYSELNLHYEFENKILNTLTANLNSTVSVTYLVIDFDSGVYKDHFHCHGNLH